MTNNTYKYLLSDLKKLKGVGEKTSNLLKRKKSIQFLICCGDCQNHTQIEANLLKLKI